ncbi:DUF551 domain-containing protein [Enterobacter sp. 22104]|uniref:DUF551 domain-containing protein n=1 Tax=Enterobacter sp. 22104 TaxID=3453876 RepID=UPI002928D433|nr:DUF551 domain-containing protein [Enterobacter ludwigii]
MITITKERLLKIQQWRETYGPGSNVVLPAEEAEELARIALASLEAEPVAYSLIFRNMDGVLNDYVNANTTFSTIEKAQAYGRGGNYVEQNDGSLQWVSDPSLDPVVVPLYTAPPAPVSVPDAYIRDERGRMMLNGKPEPRIGYGGGWNAFRATMLQGADGNSPVIPDCWVACSERMPTKQDGTVFLTWNSQYIGKELFLMGSFQCLKPEIITHWMPLPAAPQQEVNP